MLPFWRDAGGEPTLSCSGPSWLRPEFDPTVLDGSGQRRDGQDLHPELKFCLLVHHLHWKFQI